MGTLTRTRPHVTRTACSVITLLAVPAFAQQGDDPIPIPQKDYVGIYIGENNYTLLDVPTGPGLRFHFGYSNPYDRPPSKRKMIPFSHDEDNDGKDTIGYYNLRENTFYFANKNKGRVIDERIVYELPPETTVVGKILPVVADFDTDGDIDVGLYDTGNNVWYLDCPTSCPSRGPQGERGRPQSPSSATGTAMETRPSGSTFQRHRLSS